MKKLKLITIILITLSGCALVKKDSIVETAIPVPSSVLHMDNDTDVQFSNEHSNELKDQEDNRYSYLDQLSLEKREAFMKFIAEDMNLHYLEHFTPEEIVIVYLYSISIGDPAIIYAITYNNGLLPDKDTFRKEYYEYATQHDSEIAVHYRYFDTIEIDERTAEDNKVTVVVKAGVGIMTHSIMLGLQREDKVWKMDIYHGIEHLKDAAREISE